MNFVCYQIEIKTEKGVFLIKKLISNILTICIESNNSSIFEMKLLLMFEGPLAQLSLKFIL